MTRALLILALTAAPAMADTITLSDDTTITLRPSTEPGALAEVHFDNRNVNGPTDSGEYSLTMDGLALLFRFDWNADGNDDAITVQPPEGVTCKPTSCVLSLPEDTEGTIWLYDAMDVGM